MDGRDGETEELSVERLMRCSRSSPRSCTALLSTILPTYSTQHIYVCCWLFPPYSTEHVAVCCLLHTLLGTLLFGCFWALGTALTLCHTLLMY